MEVNTSRLIQIVGLKEVELIALRERVQTLEAALAVATKPESGEPKPEQKK